MPAPSNMDITYKHKLASEEERGRVRDRRRLCARDEKWGSVRRSPTTSLKKTFQNVSIRFLAKKERNTLKSYRGCYLKAKSRVWSRLSGAFFPSPRAETFPPSRGHLDIKGKCRVNFECEEDASLGPQLSMRSHSLSGLQARSLFLARYRSLPFSRSLAPGSRV